MHEHQTYIKPEVAAATVLRHLSPDSRLIVTGQIGCGKTTLAREICSQLGLAHMSIDDYHGDPDPEASASRAVTSLGGGWVAEANVWQIPVAIWEAAEIVLFLDYPNFTHYLRIIRRCLQACMKQPSWVIIRGTIRSEWHHMRIIRLYANKNRAGWDEHGGITKSTTPVIRSHSPRTTRMLLACMTTALGHSTAVEAPEPYR